MLIPKSHATWLRKASKDRYNFFVRGDCLKMHGRHWLATYDGFRLHALVTDNLVPGVYWIDKEGQVIQDKEQRLLEWSILVSWRYHDPVTMDRSTLPKKPPLNARWQLDWYTVNTWHLKEAFTFAKHARISIPVDQLPGIKVTFGDGLGDKAFAILQRSGVTGEVYPAQSVQYAESTAFTYL